MFKSLSDNVTGMFSTTKAEEPMQSERAKKAASTPPPSPAEGVSEAASASLDDPSKAAPLPETLASQLNAAQGVVGLGSPEDEVMEASTSTAHTPAIAAEENPSPHATEASSESKVEEPSEGSGDKFEDAAGKAYTAAKEWGSYFFSKAKVATKTVLETSKTLKKSVQEKTIIGDFAKEQDKFVSEKKQKDLRSDAAVPPWVGYHEEDSMKEQILSLSSDKRNFLRNPPAGVQFEFNFETTFPVAMATLKEDPRLEEMRFEVVPKRVSEHDFWRNYFYRVSLIKQSTQLSLLAQESDAKLSRKSSAASTSESCADPLPAALVSPPANEEFASDDYNADVNDEELTKEMESLRVQEKTTPTTAEGDGDVAEWEKELQDELNEFEVVGADGTGGADYDDDELEREILEQIDGAKN